MVSLWKLRGTHVLVDSMLLPLLHLTHLHLPEYRHWRQRWSSSGLSLKWSWRSHIKLSGVLEPASPGILCRSREIFQNRPSEASWTPLSPVIVSMGPGSSTLGVSPVQCFMYLIFLVRISHEDKKEGHASCLCSTSAFLRPKYFTVAWLVLIGEL